MFRRGHGMLERVKRLRFVRNAVLKYNFIDRKFRRCFCVSAAVVNRTKKTKKLDIFFHDFFSPRFRAIPYLKHNNKTKRYGSVEYCVVGRVQILIIITKICIGFRVEKKKTKNLPNGK